MSNQKRQFNFGFGLIELLVSISIMVIVISVVVAKHNAFNGAVLLRSQAYEVALQIREVQIGSLGAVGRANEFRKSYGVHFVEGESYYLTFLDEDADSLYDSNESLGKRGNLDKRFVIDEIRLESPNSSPNELSITFERPNFDAIFHNGSSVIGATAAEIDIRVVGTSGSGTGELKTIEILNTGQITVQ